MKKGGNEGKDAKKREQDNMSNKTEMLQRERETAVWYVEESGRSDRWHFIIKPCCKIISPL